MVKKKIGFRVLVRDFSDDELRCEEWKNIPGFNGYEASSIGRIRSYRNRGGKLVKEPHFIKQWIFDSGTSKTYKKCLVFIRKETKSTTIGVGRCVAAAFLGLDISNKGIFACHKDDNTANNKVENLFVGSCLENVMDCARKNRRVHHGPCGENNHSSFFTNKEAQEIRRLLLSKEYTIRGLSRKMGIDRRVFQKIKHGISYKENA